MKPYLMHAGLKSVLIVCAVLLTAVQVGLLSGCGSTIGGDTAGVGVGGTGTGGGGGGTTGTILYVMAAKAATPGQTLLSGTVVDEMLPSALVFLDKNGNYRHDAPEEPAAVTGQNGAYTLQLDPADIGQYPLVAQAVSTTADPAVGSYHLSLAKQAVRSTTGNVISPVTSLLHAMLETGSFADLAEAAAVLQAKLGLPADTDLLAEDVTTGNDPVAVAARQLAREMLPSAEPLP